MTLTGLSGAGCASRSIFSFGTQKPESTILSGPNRRLSRNSARRMPDAASITRPSTSDARLYSRSEEHTSELQSPCNLVCRLLLEKKKSYCSTLDVNPDYT